MLCDAHASVGVVSCRDGVCPGYTLLSVSRTTYLIDKEGRVLHTWASRREVFVAYLLPRQPAERRQRPRACATVRRRWRVGLPGGGDLAQRARLVVECSAALREPVAPRRDTPPKRQRAGARVGAQEQGAGPRRRAPPRAPARRRSVGQLRRRAPPRPRERARVRGAPLEPVGSPGAGLRPQQGQLRGGRRGAPDQVRPQLRAARRQGRVPQWRPAARRAPVRRPHRARTPAWQTEDRSAAHTRKLRFGQGLTVFNKAPGKTVRVCMAYMHGMLLCA